MSPKFLDLANELIVVPFSEMRKTRRPNGMKVGGGGNKFQEAATYYYGVPDIRISKEGGQTHGNGGLDDALKLNKKGEQGLSGAGGG